MAPVTVTIGARIHIGFRNLSLGRDRLYGGIGLGLEAPTAAVRAAPADGIDVEQELAADYADVACDRLGVNGASVRVIRQYPRHVGLGSGTRLALAILTAIARAHGQSVSVREHAPALGRGGRSGVGVATFEAGGLVVDAGHPTAEFTTDPPAAGSWTVPPVSDRVPIPDDWRILLLVPKARRGQSGRAEDASMRTVVESADPAIADEIESVVRDELIPAVRDADIDRTGAAMTAIGRANGQWYQSVQDGRYRAPADTVIESLESVDVLHGLGQSSWGPTVYGLVRARDSAAARRCGQRSLAEAGVDGTVRVVSPANTGVLIDRQ